MHRVLYSRDAFDKWTKRRENLGQCTGLSAWVMSLTNGPMDDDDQVFKLKRYHSQIDQKDEEIDDNVSGFMLERYH